MNQDYDTMNIDFATGVAASAYAIHSKEQEELQYQKNIRDSFDHTLVNTKDNEIIITNMPSTAGRETTRRLSNKETDKAGNFSTIYINRNAVPIRKLLFNIKARP